jgi:hypothetical protein
LHPHFVATKFIKEIFLFNFIEPINFLKSPKKKIFIPIAPEWIRHYIKFFLELPIFEKNEVHVAKSFGNSNEALLEMAFMTSSFE